MLMGYQEIVARKSTPIAYKYSTVQRLTLGIGIFWPFSG
jgi:hypothetical protein